MVIETKYIIIKGKKIWTKRVFNSNNKYTLVLLHDALGSVSQWKDYPILLFKKLNINILIYDRFGYGKSDIAIKEFDPFYFNNEAMFILPKILDYFSINNPLIYGHSDGGTIALIYAANFKSCVLISESAHVKNEAITRKGIQNTLINYDYLLENLKKHHGNKAEILLDNWKRFWLNNNMINWDLTGKLKQINTPTLIIQGTNDPYGSIDQVQSISKLVKCNKEIFLVKDCKHFPYKEYEKLVLDKISDFIKLYCDKV